MSGWRAPGAGGRAQPRHAGRQREPEAEPPAPPARLEAAPGTQRLGPPNAFLDIFLFHFILGCDRAGFSSSIGYSSRAGTVHVCVCKSQQLT